MALNAISIQFPFAPLGLTHKRKYQYPANMAGELTKASLHKYKPELRLFMSPESTTLTKSEFSRARKSKKQPNNSP